MKVTVRYFASIREALGCSEESVETNAATAGALRDELRARGGVWADALGRHRVVRLAVAQLMCDEETPLGEGSEVAFFPPVTGG